GFLNLFSLMLVSFSVVQILSAKAPRSLRPAWRPQPFATAGVPAEPHPPDIYYIILDGYARGDVMKELFAYDNSGFLDRLRAKGFYVASHSTANYCQTPLSLSASLNAIYLDDLVRGLGSDQTELSDFIGRSNVVASLRPWGYRFVTFSTGFDP